MELNNCTYCPVCGFLDPGGYNAQCGYCKSPMERLNVNFDYFVEMFGNNAPRTEYTKEFLIKVGEKAEQYILENFGKDHPLYNPQKRQNRLDSDAAAERGETIPTCPNCGSHQIQAVCDSFPFGTIWRVCLACGHKF